MAIEREVGEIHTKVDTLINLVEKQNGRVSKLEGDVSSLRRWQAFVMGICATIGAAATFIGQKVGHLSTLIHKAGEFPHL